MGWLLPAALQGGGGHRGMSLVGGYYGMAASPFFLGGGQQGEGLLWDVPCTAGWGCTG